MTPKTKDPLEPDQDEESDENLKYRASVLSTERIDFKDSEAGPRWKTIFWLWIAGKTLTLYPSHDLSSYKPTIGQPLVTGTLFVQYVEFQGKIKAKYVAFKT